MSSDVGKPTIGAPVRSIVHSSCSPRPKDTDRLLAGAARPTKARIAFLLGAARVILRSTQVERVVDQQRFFALIAIAQADDWLAGIGWQGLGGRRPGRWPRDR